MTAVEHPPEDDGPKAIDLGPKLDSILVILTGQEPIPTFEEWRVFNHGGRGWAIHATPIIENPGVIGIRRFKREVTQEDLLLMAIRPVIGHSEDDHVSVFEATGRVFTGIVEHNPNDDVILEVRDPVDLTLATLMMGMIVATAPRTYVRPLKQNGGPLRINVPPGGFKIASEQAITPMDEREDELSREEKAALDKRD